MKVDSASASRPKAPEPEENKPTVRAQKGETLADVARKNDTTEEELKRLNPHIKDGGELVAGQEISLPPPRQAAPAEEAPPASPEPTPAGVAAVPTTYTPASADFIPQTAMPTGQPDAEVPAADAHAAAQLKEIRGRVGFGDGVAVAARREHAGSAVKVGGECTALAADVRDSLSKAVQTGKKVLPQAEWSNDLGHLATDAQKLHGGVKALEASLQKITTQLDAGRAPDYATASAQAQKLINASADVGAETGRLTRVMDRDAAVRRSGVSELLKESQGGLKDLTTRLRSIGGTLKQWQAQDVRPEPPATRLASSTAAEGPRAAPSEPARATSSTTPVVGGAVHAGLLAAVQAAPIQVSDVTTPDDARTGRIIEGAPRSVRDAPGGGPSVAMNQDLVRMASRGNVAITALDDQPSEAAGVQGRLQSVNGRDAPALVEQGEPERARPTVAARARASTPRTGESDESPPPYTSAAPGSSARTESTDAPPPASTNTPPGADVPRDDTTVNAGNMWHEQAVNMVNQAGTEQGGLVQQQIDKNHDVAREALEVKRTDDEGPARQVSTEDMAATAGKAGLNAEKLDPAHLQEATRYVNEAGTAGEQAVRMQKALNNFSILENTGVPKFDEKDVKTIVDSRPVTQGPPLTEADAEKIGTGLGEKPPQALWNEHAVNVFNQRGQEQGGITQAQVDKNGQYAAQVMNPDGKADPKGPPRELSAGELAGMVRDTGVPLEKQDPNQLQAATNYINGAKTQEEQQDRLRKTLNNFQVLDKIGAPRLQEQEAKDLMWGAAKVPGHAGKAGSANADFQQVARAVNTPGNHEFKIGSHNVKLSVNDQNSVTSSSTKKPGFLSKVGGFIKKVAPVVLKVASFIPGPVGIVARVATGIINTVKAIKSGSILGAVAGVASTFAAGVTGALGKGLETASKGLRTAVGVANGVAQAARGVQSVSRGGLAGIVGGVAGVVGGVATGLGAVANGAANGLSTAARHLGDASRHLQNAATGIGAVQNVRAADRAVNEARTALASARASGDAAAIQQAEQQLSAAERNKRSSLLGAASAAASVGASYASGPTRNDDGTSTGGGLQHGLNVAAGALNTARAVNDRDIMGAAAAGLSTASTIKDGAAGPRENLDGTEKFDPLRAAARGAGAADSVVKSERAEQAAAARMKDAESALSQARASGDPAAIARAERALKDARGDAVWARQDSWDARSSAAEALQGQIASFKGTQADKRTLASLRTEADGAVSELRAQSAGLEGPAADEARAKLEAVEERRRQLEVAEKSGNVVQLRAAADNLLAAQADARATAERLADERRQQQDEQRRLEPGASTLGSATASELARGQRQQPTADGQRPEPSAEQAAPEAPREPERYTIKGGDALEKIAVARGLTVEDLLKANPDIKDRNSIRQGQEIIIPDATADARAAGNLKTFHDTHKGGAVHTHNGNVTVGANQTLGDILKQNPHLTRDELLTLNPQLASGATYEGQKLLVPREGELIRGRDASGRTTIQYSSREEQAAQQAAQQRAQAEQDAARARAIAQGMGDLNAANAKANNGSFGTAVASVFTLGAVGEAAETRNNLVGAINRQHQAALRDGRIDEREYAQLQQGMRGAGQTISDVAGIRGEVLSTVKNTGTSIALVAAAPLTGGMSLGAAAATMGAVGAASHITQGVAFEGRNTTGSQVLQDGLIGAAMGASSVVTAGTGGQQLAARAMGFGTREAAVVAVQQGVVSGGRRAAGGVVQAIADGAVGQVAGDVAEAAVSRGTYVDEKGNVRSAGQVASNLLKSPVATSMQVGEMVADGRYLEAGLSMAASVGMPSVIGAARGADFTAPKVSERPSTTTPSVGGARPVHVPPPAGPPGAAPVGQGATPVVRTDAPSVEPARARAPDASNTTGGGQQGSPQQQSPRPANPSSVEAAPSARADVTPAPRTDVTTAPRANTAPSTRADVTPAPRTDATPPAASQGPVRAGHPDATQPIPIVGEPSARVGAPAPPRAPDPPRPTAAERNLADEAVRLRREFPPAALVDGGKPGTPVKVERIDPKTGVRTLEEGWRIARPLKGDPPPGRMWLAREVDGTTVYRLTTPEVVRRTNPELRAHTPPRPGEALIAPRERVNAATGERTTVHEEWSLTGRRNDDGTYEVQRPRIGQDGKPARAADGGAEMELHRLTADQLEALRDGPRRPADVVARQLDAQLRLAADANPRVKQFVHDLAAATGGSPQMGPLKQRQKALGKVMADYGGNPNLLKDLARGSIFYEEATRISEAAGELARRLGVDLVRVKDRFAQPTDYGYRDVLANIRDKNGAVVELQLHHGGVLRAKDVAGHAFYDAGEAIVKRAKADGNRALTAAETATIEGLKAASRAMYADALAHPDRFPPKESAAHRARLEELRNADPAAYEDALAHPERFPDRINPEFAAMQHEYEAMIREILARHSGGGS